MKGGGKSGLGTPLSTPTTINRTHYSPILTPEGSKVRRVYLVVHDVEIRIQSSTSYQLYFDSTGNRNLLQSDLSFACL